MQCVARDSSCDHATCPQRTFDENSQHSASNTVQLGSARKFIGTGAVRASIYSLSLSSRLVSKSMDKMQLDTKSRSGSGKRKMTLMSLFNPFQSFSILFNPFQSRQTQISGVSQNEDIWGLFPVNLSTNGVSVSAAKSYPAIRDPETHPWAENKLRSWCETSKDRNHEKVGSTWKHHAIRKKPSHHWLTHS